MKKCLLILLACWSALALADAAPLTAMPGSEVQARQRHDLEAVLRYRGALRQIVDYAHGQPQLFPAEGSGKRLLTLEQREAVRGLWQRLFEYYLALDSVGRLHADFYRLPQARLRAGSFRVSQAAFLAEYRAALEFIEATRHDESLDILLNEAMPGLGVPAGSFDQFKFRFLNAARASEFAARELLGRRYGAADPALRQALADDTAFILKQGKGSGVTMTVVNALDVVRKTGFDAWFPVQSGVAEWMGDTKVYRAQQHNLISAEQAAALPARLQPGDILLERHEWYLSNVGLPGFWPHAVLYIGSPAERARYFDTPEIHEWVRSQGEPSGDFEQLLARRFPQVQAESAKPLEQGHPARVIEAVSEGVVFSSIEQNGNADALAALRPRNSRLEKAQAVLRSFGYFGRPYDFNFDFRSDSALVCSELVFKSYEPGPGMRGLSFPTSEVLGRLATSPNDIARQFDEQFGTAAQQTDLVLFLDGHEKTRRAVEATPEDFRASWRRPKWHILTQSLAKR